MSINFENIEYEKVTLQLYKDLLNKHVEVNQKITKLLLEKPELLPYFLPEKDIDKDDLFATGNVKLIRLIRDNLHIGLVHCNMICDAYKDYLLYSEMKE